MQPVQRLQLTSGMQMRMSAGKREAMEYLQGDPDHCLVREEVSQAVSVLGVTRQSPDRA